MRCPTFLRSIMALMLALSLGACAAPPPAPAFPEITFTHLPQISLAVARIEVINTFTPNTSANHIESRMPTSPEKALRNWARDRLQATGVSGVAKFIIEDASMTETNLKGIGGLKGYVTNEQAERYDTRVRARIILEGVPRVSEAYAEAEAVRSQTLAENATVNKREQLWFDLTEAVMKDFDGVMAASIKTHLGDFVR